MHGSRFSRFVKFLRAQKRGVIAITSAIAIFILALVVVLSSIRTGPNEEIGVTPLPDQEQISKTTDQGREQLVSKGDFNIDWLLYTSRNNITEAVPTSQQPMKGLKENTEGKLEISAENFSIPQKLGRKIWLLKISTTLEDGSAGTPSGKTNEPNSTRTENLYKKPGAGKEDGTSWKYILYTACSRLRLCAEAKS